MSDTDVFPPDEPAQSFLNFLAQQRRGEVASELSDALRDLRNAIDAHLDKWPGGKVSGTVDIKIKISADGGAYKIETTYTVTRPKAPVAGTIMWRDARGNLVTHNPRQLTMFSAQEAK